MQLTNFYYSLVNSLLSKGNKEKAFVKVNKSLIFLKKKLLLNREFVLKKILFSSIIKSRLKHSSLFSYRSGFFNDKDSSEMFLNFKINYFRGRYIKFFKHKFINKKLYKIKFIKRKLNKKKFDLRKIEKKKKNKVQLLFFIIDNKKKVEKISNRIMILKNNFRILKTTNFFFSFFFLDRKNFFFLNILKKLKPYKNNVYLFYYKLRYFRWVKFFYKKITLKIFLKKKMEKLTKKFNFREMSKNYDNFYFRNTKKKVTAFFFQFLPILRLKDKNILMLEKKKNDSLKLSLKKKSKTKKVLVKFLENNIHFLNFKIKKLHLKKKLKKNNLLKGYKVTRFLTTIRSIEDYSVFSDDKYKKLFLISKENESKNKFFFSFFLLSLVPMFNVFLSRSRVNFDLRPIRFGGKIRYIPCIINPEKDIRMTLKNFIKIVKKNHETFVNLFVSLFYSFLSILTGYSFLTKVKKNFYMNFSKNKIYMNFLVRRKVKKNVFVFRSSRRRRKRVKRT